MSVKLTISFDPSDEVQVREARDLVDGFIPETANQGDLFAGKTDPEPVTDDTGGKDEEEGLDSNGLPWDVRIHAGSRKKNKDGTWKAKRGVKPTDDLYVKVVAELKADGDPGEEPDLGTEPPGNDEDELPPPPPPPAPAPAPERAPETFAELAGIVGTLLMEDRLTEENLNECCQVYGVPGFDQLQEREQMVPLVYQAIMRKANGGS